MNIFELKGIKKAEKEYENNIPEITATIKKQIISQLSADIEIIKARATFEIKDLIEKYSADLKGKISEVKIRKGDPGKDAVVDYDKIIKKVVTLLPPPVPGKDAIVDYKAIVSRVLTLLPPPEENKPVVVDYARIISEVAKAIDVPKIPTTEEIVANLKDVEFDALKIKNLSRLIKKHGGGMSLTAGSNITVTRLSGGRYRIDAAASSSSAAIIAATDSGDHKNYILAQAATTSSYFVVMNGGVYQTDDDDFPFSVTGTTLTFTSTLPTDLASKKIKLVCV